MWLPESRAAARRFLHPLAALAIAASVAGCFQPLYADRSLTGGPGPLEAMAHVEVLPIPAPRGSALERIAVLLQNELKFGLTGGAGAAPPTHQLAIRLGGSRTAVVTTEARPEFESVALDANYTLTDIATKKPVLNASATARATLSVPGAQQRFARSRGQLDAERRAAQVIADQIRARLASYFMAGT